jgi:hypothetical protein
MGGGKLFSVTSGSARWNEGAAVFEGGRGFPESRRPDKEPSSERRHVSHGQVKRAVEAA